MSKSVRSFLSLLLVLQLIIPYSVFAAPVGEFTSVVGKVTQTREKKLIIPIVKSPVQLKDLIITEQASSATMIFSDESSIVLSGNAKLEIKEFLFKDKSRTGIFSLAMGKLTATVSKYIGGANVFEVQSPTAIVGVRGTGFEFDEAINAENKNMATVSCTEGSLNLSALSPTGKVVSTAVLEAGQMAVIIGGVITISAIGASGGGASAATTTGATVVAASAATAGISTTAIVGVAAGVTAVGAVGAAASSGGGGGGSSSSSDSGSSGGCTSKLWFVINKVPPECTDINNVCAGQTILFFLGVGAWPTIDEKDKALAGQYAVITLDGLPLNVSYHGTFWQGDDIPVGYSDTAEANWVATSGTHTVTGFWTNQPSASSCTFTISK